MKLTPARQQQLLRCVGLCPLWLLQGLGFVLGSLFSRMRSRRLDTTLMNLQLCFPAMPERQRLRLARQSLRQSVINLLESAWFWAQSKPRLRAAIQQVEGFTQVQAARAAGKPVVLLSPHMGAWELVGLHVSWEFPITTLYKPQSGAVDQYIHQARQRFGANLVPTDARGVKSLFQSLRGGQVVGILPDQDPGGGGVFAPWFGKQANTPALVPRLIQKTKAAAFFVFAVRLPSGRFKITYLEVDDGLYSSDSQVAAAALNAGVERVVCRQPEQYWWSYQRFRRRPAGEKSPYKKRQRRSRPAKNE